ncbi:MAG: hypothetical protein RL748_544 [Pseudomonadota bacterium]
MTAYAARRAALLAQIQVPAGAAAIIATAPEQVRNNDCDFPFRFDSNFFYLSGFTEPNSVMVLIAHPNGRHESLLFCRVKDVEREIWDGFRYGPDAAREQFGFDAAFPIDSLGEEIARRLGHLSTLYYPFGSQVEREIPNWVQTMRQRTRLAPGMLRDVNMLLAEMRLFKDESEILSMQRAADISSSAHHRAMQTTCPGMAEYQVEAEILYEFRRQGSQSPAYTSIVASGANACVLHYVGNAAQCRDGDLLLIDAGCELDGYASDITRTFPVNGRFSGPQKDCYELVLAAHQAAIDQALPGRNYSAMNDAAVKVLAQGMLDLGLLDAGKVGNLDDVIEKKAYRQFYMHSTGHWLGLDVHDVGDYRTGPIIEGAEREYRALQAGMVVTVEPGLYVRPSEGVPEQFWNIGIRIEDDVLVTADGQRILSNACVRSVADIEAMMQQSV